MVIVEYGFLLQVRSPYVVRVRRTSITPGDLTSNKNPYSNNNHFIIWRYFQHFIRQNSMFWRWANEWLPSNRVIVYVYKYRVLLCWFVFTYNMCHNFLNKLWKIILIYLFGRLSLDELIHILFGIFHRLFHSQYSMVDISSVSASYNKNIFWSKYKFCFINRGFEILRN